MSETLRPPQMGQLVLSRREGEYIHCDTTLAEALAVYYGPNAERALAAIRAAGVEPVRNSLWIDLQLVRLNASKATLLVRAPQATHIRRDDLGNLNLEADRGPGTVPRREPALTR